MVEQLREKVSDIEKQLGETRTEVLSMQQKHLNLERQLDDAKSTIAAKDKILEENQAVRYHPHYLQVTDFE